MYNLYQDNSLIFHSFIHCLEDPSLHPSNLIDILDRFTLEEERNIELAHQRLFSAVFTRGDSMSGSNPPQQFPQGAKGWDTGNRESQAVTQSNTSELDLPSGDFQMAEDLSSYQSSHIPADVNPMFDSMGMGFLNPYRHIQPGMAYSASSYGTSETRNPPSFPQPSYSEANAAQDQGWSSEHRPTQPSHSSQLPAFGQSDTMTGEFPLLLNQTTLAPVSPTNPNLPGNTTSPLTLPQAGSTYPSIGHVPSASQPTPSSSGAPLPQVDGAGATSASKANKARAWTAKHTAAVINRVTSSQELYDQIMVTAKTLRNVDQANRVWGTLTTEEFSGNDFTPTYVGKQWWLVVETAYDLADFADGADDTLRSNVEEFTKHVRQKVLERLQASNGAIARFKSQNVSAWFNDPVGGWFAQLWARHLGRGQPAPAPNQRGRSLLHVKDARVPLTQSEASVAPSTPPTSAFTFSMPPGSFASAPSVISQAPGSSNRKQTADVPMRSINDQAPLPNTTILTRAVPSPPSSAASVGQPGHHGQPTSGPSAAPRPNLEHIGALEWRVRARRESLPSQAEFVRQGAALTENHNEISRKKGKVMDAFVKNSNVAATNDMALVHTRVIECLGSVSRKFMETQGNLAIQAFNAGTAVTNAGTTVTDAGNGATNPGQASTALPAAPAGTTTDDPGRELVSRALASIGLLLSMSPTSTVDHIVDTANRVVTASVQQSSSSRRPDPRSHYPAHPDSPETGPNHTGHYDQEGMAEGTADEACARSMTGGPPAEPSANA